MTNQEFVNILEGLWDTELSESQRKTMLDESFEEGYRKWINGEDESQKNIGEEFKKLG